MTLNKLKSAPIVLFEDDRNNNILPLIAELAQYEKSTVNIFCYEQPIPLWKTVFRDHSNVAYHDEYNPNFLNKYTTCKTSVVVDSVNQMSLCLGWSNSLKYIKQLHNNSNIIQIILIMHRDCLSHFSKLQIHLNHIASAIISYDQKTSCTIKIQIKKNGKVVTTEETFYYDATTETLKLKPVIKQEKRGEEPERLLPSNLSTFKIEVEQTEKLEKYKLKLPYMSRINEGESKVHYEPDAVDDWDEEDPDEDLNI